jgi:hypothetical protein
VCGKRVTVARLLRGTSCELHGDCCTQSTALLRTDRQRKFLSSPEPFAPSYRERRRKIARETRFVHITEESLADQTLALAFADRLRSDRRIVEKAERFGKFLWLQRAAMLSSPMSDAVDSLWGVGRLLKLSGGMRHGGERTATY